ncbi:MAG: hypothetical protein RMA76_12975 [Deltaproteobacteria bacterium]|jgi:hypothetical protein
MSEDNTNNALGMPVAVAKQQLRDDPHTHEIAKGLGVDVEEYIDQVIYFAQNPNVDPEMHVLPDEELAEAGANVATEGEVLGWFKGVASGEIDITEPHKKERKTEYTKQKLDSETMRAAAGFHVEKAAPQQAAPRGEIRASGRGGAALREQLLQQQRNTQMMRDRRSGRQPAAKKEA